MESDILHAFICNLSDGFEPSQRSRPQPIVLLFHIAVTLDVNECKMKFLQQIDIEKAQYMKQLYTSVAQGAIQETGALFEHQLESMFTIYHSYMRKDLNQKVGAFLAMPLFFGKRRIKIKKSPTRFLCHSKRLQGFTFCLKRLPHGLISHSATLESRRKTIKILRIFALNITELLLVYVKSHIANTQEVS